LAIAVAAVAATLREPHTWSTQYDWRYFESVLEVSRRSVVWYHQFPLWNAYMCGGEVLLANPQSEVAAPTFLLHVIFGVALGIRLALIVYFFCALDGMYRLCRDYKLGEAAAIAGAVFFAGTGWWGLHVSSGHSNFASAALFPYLLLFYRRALDETPWVLPLGAMAAWVVGLGGTSTTALAMVLLFVNGVIDVVVRRSARPMLILVAGALTGGVIGAFRLLPALEFAVDHPRRNNEGDANSLWSILKNGVLWGGLAPTPGKKYWFHEYSWRMPLITVPLVAWGVMARRPTRRYFIVAIVAALIVAGTGIPYGPWWLLKQLPLFRDLRVPSRYSLLLALSAALVAAGALDDILARLRGHLRTALAVVVIIAAAADGLSFDWFLFSTMFHGSPFVAQKGTPFYQELGSWDGMLNHVLAGHGSVGILDEELSRRYGRDQERGGCDEEAPLQRAATYDIGPGAAMAKLEGTGKIVALRWTPNRVEADVELPGPARVVFNQNWNEHWKTSRGEVVRGGPKLPRDRDGGRLAVDAPAGTYTLVVRYLPRSFVIGSVLSGVGTPAAAAYFIWWWRRRRRRSEDPDSSTPANPQSAT
jgi:hypothetical protein